MAGMNGHLITIEDGSAQEPGLANIERLLSSSTLFWLDLADLGHDEAESLLGSTFGFHPLAVEDADHFSQRPKLDAYDAFTLLVVYGASTSGQLIEVHCFITERYLLTVHKEACPELASLAERWRQSPNRRGGSLMLLYRVVDTLVDGYFPVLAALDDQIDEIEDEILRRPTDEQLGRLFDMKRSLIGMRKVVGPQRDVFASLLADAAALPGMGEDSARYFRDIYDHLIRVSDLVDSYRDLLSGALDTHLSTVSNRLNVVMKQLTIIATVFLPMSFLTGFFGQNFSWMVNRLGGLPVFASVGIGLQLIVAVVLVMLFRGRGWLTADGTVPPAVPGKRPTLSRAKRWHTINPLTTRTSPSMS